MRQSFGYTPSPSDLQPTPIGRLRRDPGTVGSDVDDLRALALRQRKPGSRLFGPLTAQLAAPSLPALRPPPTRLPTVDPATYPADPRLIDRFGAMACLREGILPWRETGTATVIVAAEPDAIIRNRPALEQTFGPIIPTLAPLSAIEATILNLRGGALDHAACHRVSDIESCRGWNARALPFWTAFGVILLLAAGFFAPRFVFTGLTALAILSLIFATLLKSAAAFAALRSTPKTLPPPLIAHLPIVSIMVPLYREARIAGRLISRLEQLDYPRDCLDILLVVEEDDQITRDALRNTTLPVWMRVVVAPVSRLKTKPRALNHALDRCRGSVIGIYDAEDAPAPDQIQRVVDRFHQRPAQVACLQGVLDFYNPRSNWLSRCFTLEYAAWFRVLLPGMARLGLAVPLGGTTLFFRRAALEQLGAWDAHNVTEDADLGMRLARHGYRTELIDTVTLEEANCRVLPWVRQRSRWLKGYMMTYAVQMRQPVKLLQQLGWWKFAGVQVFFLTTIFQFLLTPLLLSFWLIAFGLPHPLTGNLSPELQSFIFGVFLASEAVLLVVTLTAMRQTKHHMNPVWALALHLYFPLGALAAYKAVWELVTQPFYWDKTAHGLCDAD